MANQDVDWSTSLFSTDGRCCTSLCCLSSFMPCVQFGENYDLLHKQLGGPSNSPTAQMQEKGDWMMRCMPGYSGTVAGGIYGGVLGTGIIGSGIASSSCPCAAPFFWVLIPLPFCWLAEFRGATRRQWDIKGARGSVLWDCGSSLLCSCCVLMQTNQQLEKGGNPASVKPPTGAAQYHPTYTSNMSFN